MPQTARDLGVRNSFDPRQNLDGAARYLRRQLDRFEDRQRALGAYHAGPERTARGFAWLPDVTHAYVADVLEFDREYRSRGLP